MSGASAFTFDAAVGAAEVAGSSALYKVTIRTNLAEYREHGEGAPAPEVQQQSGELDEDALEDAFKVVTVPERTIVVKRSYTAFCQARPRSCRLCALRCRALLSPLTPRALAAAATTCSCETLCPRAALRAPPAFQSCRGSRFSAPRSATCSCGSEPSKACSRTLASTWSLRLPTPRAPFSAVREALSDVQPVCRRFVGGAAETC